ncbi:ATP-binding protein [Massilia sp. Dwa41.01b]|uniref:ATP-binding protein n=1 Tax=Massilia sp. Dwa41.01b TaxID=2709302 RepID=UPI001E63B13D|nr:ATP-binding protein [Massilia sp. Dwa41.01b]
MAINARDAMGGEGRLAIGLANVRLDGAAGGEHVCLSITDTGCGMPPEVQAKIFDPFYTTKAPGKGTGLGMSMVYGFVKQSGGEIRIESRPGQGTTILIYLPRAHGAVVHERDIEHVSLHGAGETILVVDDDAAVVASTTEILKGLGYDVLCAGDGQAALAIRERRGGRPAVHRPVDARHGRLRGAGGALPRACPRHRNPADLRAPARRRVRRRYRAAAQALWPGAAGARCAHACSMAATYPVRRRRCRPRLPPACPRSRPSGRARWRWKRRMGGPSSWSRTTRTRASWPASCSARSAMPPAAAARPSRRSRCCASVPSTSCSPT